MGGVLSSLEARVINIESQQGVTRRTINYVPTILLSTKFIKIRVKVINENF